MNRITTKKIYICDSGYKFETCDFFERCADRYWCKFRQDGVCRSEKAIADFENKTSKLGEPSEQIKSN